MSNQKKFHVDQILSEAATAYYHSKSSLTQDFITAAHLGPLFSLPLANWLVSRWCDNGCKKFIWLEMGPGDGSLFSQMWQATGGIDGLHEAVACIIFLESSEKMAERQRSIVSSLACGKELVICNSFEEIISLIKKSELGVIGIANEFFDALPVKQFCKEGGIIYEINLLYDKVSGSYTPVLGPALSIESWNRIIDFTDIVDKSLIVDKFAERLFCVDDEVANGVKKSKINKFKGQNFEDKSFLKDQYFSGDNSSFRDDFFAWESIPDGVLLELSPIREEVVFRIASCLVSLPFFSLLSVDYGYWDPIWSSTIQAILKHQKLKNPFSFLGQADITSLVDFRRLSSVFNFSLSLHKESDNFSHNRVGDSCVDSEDYDYCDDRKVKSAFTEKEKNELDYQYQTYNKKVYNNYSTQGNFLCSWGVEGFAEQLLCIKVEEERWRLLRQMDRLIGNGGMGQLFKVLDIGWKGEN